MQSMAIPVLTHHMEAVIAAHGGGYLLENSMGNNSTPTVTVHRNNLKAKKAMKRMRKWFETILSGDLKREHLHQTKLRFYE